jgi:hypothetical protein
MQPSFKSFKKSELVKTILDKLDITFLPTSDEDPSKKYFTVYKGDDPIGIIGCENWDTHHITCHPKLNETARGLGKAVYIAICLKFNKIIWEWNDAYSVLPKSISGKALWNSLEKWVLCEKVVIQEEERDGLEIMTPQLTLRKMTLDTVLNSPYLQKILEK